MSSTKGAPALCAAASPRTSSGVTPDVSAACVELLHHRAVGDRVGERDAELDDVGAGVDEGRDQDGGWSRATDGRR